MALYDADVKETHAQFDDHINSMSMSDMFYLMERIADGEYDGFLAAYQRETERLKELHRSKVAEQ
jgi:L-arabinose isomerase